MKNSKAGHMLAPEDVEIYLCVVIKENILV
jgi:hypothetical protein